MAQTLYVANANNGKVSTYSTNGTLINDSFITGLGQAIGIAATNNVIYVSSANSNRISSYDAITGDEETIREATAEAARGQAIRSARRKRGDPRRWGTSLRGRGR